MSSFIRFTSMESRWSLLGPSTERTWSCSAFVESAEAKDSSQTYTQNCEAYTVGVLKTSLQLLSGFLVVFSLSALPGSGINIAQDLPVSFLASSAFSLSSLWIRLSYASTDRELGTEKRKKSNKHWELLVVNWELFILRNTTSVSIHCSWTFIHAQELQFLSWAIFNKWKQYQQGCKSPNSVHIQPGCKWHFIQCSVQPQRILFHCIHCWNI